MAKKKNLKCMKLISIEEPHPKYKSKNRYAASMAWINRYEDIRFCFNGPFTRDYLGEPPILCAITKILERYRAYEIRWNLKRGKNEVSKFLGKIRLERFNEDNAELNWVLAFDKKSKESKTEKMLAKGIVPKNAGPQITENADELSQKCDLLVMQMESSNMDHDALLIISSKKIGSRLKKFLKKYGKDMPTEETIFDNFFDYLGVERKLTKKQKKGFR